MAVTQVLMVPGTGSLGTGSEPARCSTVLWAPGLSKSLSPYRALQGPAVGLSAGPSDAQECHKSIQMS